MEIVIRLTEDEYKKVQDGRGKPRCATCGRIVKFYVEEVDE